MTQSHFRLVVDPDEDGLSSIFNLPPLGAAGLHIHLHLGTESARELHDDEPAPLKPDTLLPEATQVGLAGRWRWPRRILMGAGGLVAVFFAYEFGSDAGANHARDDMLPRTTLPMPIMRQHGQVAPSRFAPYEPATATAPDQMPPSVRRFLAQPPTVTPAPGIEQPSSGAPDGFGLRR